MAKLITVPTELSLHGCFPRGVNDQDTGYLYTSKIGAGRWGKVDNLLSSHFKFFNFL